jgi:hypothetical protein
MSTNLLLIIDRNEILPALSIELTRRGTSSSGILGAVHTVAVLDLDRVLVPTIDAE